jgi:[acyl-carrier-protein] S-malonyltransferase
MAAVLSLDPEAIERVCTEVSRDGHVVQAANFNAPGQVVVSGDTAAVEAAMPKLQEAGARRVVPLPVSGAFHSPLMAYAVEGLSEALRVATIHAPRCPIYLNVTAQPTQDPDEIRARLLDQLTAPVRWVQTLEAMQADGADRFVEVGAGNVLSGLVKRTLGREVETAQVGKADQVGGTA